MSAFVECVLTCDHPYCANESSRAADAPFHGDMAAYVDDIRDMGLWEPRPWLHLAIHDLDLCHRHWPNGWTQELVAYVNEKPVPR